MTVLPSLKESGYPLKIIASSGGASGTLLANKYNISKSTTDYKEIINDDDVDEQMDPSIDYIGDGV